MKQCLDQDPVNSLFPKGTLVLEREWKGPCQASAGVVDRVEFDQQRDKKWAGAAGWTRSTRRPQAADRLASQLGRKNVDG